MDRFQHIKSMRASRNVFRLERKIESNEPFTTKRIPEKTSKKDESMDSTKAQTKSVDPNVWGPPFWDLLFTLCFKCSSDCMPDFQNLFIGLETVLPCPHCRRSYISHKKALRPESLIQDETHSAAHWLWKIHDMVNAKLGKIAISFDKLEKRHKSMSLISHDLQIVDAFAFMTLSVAEIDRKIVIDMIQVISRLLNNANKTSRMNYRIPHIMDQMDAFTTESLWASLLELKNRLHVLNGMPPLNMSEFTDQYEQAVV